MKERNNLNVTFVRLTLEGKNLNTHILTTGHEGNKQFKCGICNASFGEKGSLNKHVSRVHEGMKQ